MRRMFRLTAKVKLHLLDDCYDWWPCCLSVEDTVIKEGKWEIIFREHPNLFQVMSALGSSGEILLSVLLPLQASLVGMRDRAFLVAAPRLWNVFPQEASLVPFLFFWWQTKTILLRLGFNNWLGSEGCWFWMANLIILQYLCFYVFLLFQYYCMLNCF